MNEPFENQPNEDVLRANESRIIPSIPGGVVIEGVSEDIVAVYIPADLADEYGFTNGGFPCRVVTERYVPLFLKKFISTQHVTRVILFIKNNKMTKSQHDIVKEFVKRQIELSVSGSDIPGCYRAWKLVSEKYPLAQVMDVVNMWERQLRL